MKNTAGKKISAVLLVLMLFVSLACNAFAETIQDRLERELNELVDQYNSADADTQQSLEERFDQFLKENNLDDMDLGSLTDTDIGKIISDLGNNLALEDLIGLMQDAWSSGSAMIQDVLNGGLGTADGSNTATTKEPATSPNVIIAGTAPATQNGAVGIPQTVAQNNTTAAEATTYDVGATTAASIVGPGLTTAEPVSIADISATGMSTSSIIVLVVLSVATVAVIVAIVIFFVLKRK